MDRRWLDPAAFAALVVKGEVGDDDAIRKGVVTTVEKSDSPSKLTFTISTEDIDHDRDVISVDGWDLKIFKANPVIQWAHSYSTPPIGRALKLWKEDRSLKATAEFTSAELNPFGDMIYRLYLGGFMKAVSVGFRADEYSFDEKRGGLNIKRQTLLEFSAVPVPANPHALMDAKSAGIDVALYVKWAEDTLKAVKHVWVPGAELVDPEPLVVIARDLKGAVSAIEKLREESERRDSDVLARIDALEAKAPAPAATQDDDPDYFTLDASASDEAEIDLTDDAVRAGIRDAVADHIKAEVRGAINALTGRVD